MNVTSNGYYSQQYLNEQQRKQAVRSPYNQQNFYPNQSYSLYHPYSPSNSPKKIIVEFDENDPIPDHLPMEFTPSQRELFINNVRPANTKSRSESTIYPPSGSHRSTASLPAEPAVEYDDVESKDQLEETITPAQLNYIQSQHHFTPYTASPRGPYVPQEYYPPREQQRPKNKNGDYYIRQKKRYDNAKVVKPKMYSHKTLHDVFENKSEKLDKYNPMDMIFEGKADKPKPSFFDKMQNKLTKEKYEDYNYYDHRRKKTPPSKDVFVDNNSDDDDDDDDDYLDDDYDDDDGGEMVEVDQVVTTGEGKNKETKVIKKKVPLKKIMRQKLNIAKKELGRDFADYSKRQRDINESLKKTKEELKKTKEAERLAQRLAEKERLKEEKMELKRKERAKAKEKEKAKAKAKAEKKENEKEGESSKDSKSKSGENDSKSDKNDKEAKKETKDGSKDEAKDEANKETKEESETANTGWLPYLASWWVYPEEDKKEEETDSDKKKDDDKESVKSGKSNKTNKSSDKSDVSDVSSVKTVVVPPTPFEKNMKKVIGFSKNSRKFMKHWDEPATKLFHRDLLEAPSQVSGAPSTRAPSVIGSTTKSNKAASIVASSKKVFSGVGSLKEVPQSVAGSAKSSRISKILSGSDDNPTEIVVECDDNEAEDQFTEEMYYNPTTKQLEPNPPTSASSMINSQNFGDSKSIMSSKKSSYSKSIISGDSGRESSSSSSTMTYQFNFDPNAPIVVVSTWINLIKRIQIMKMLYAPIDIIGEFIPGLQGVVVFVELILFIWILYELSRLVDALCMMVKAFCAPMIAVGRFMNRVV